MLLTLFYYELKRTSPKINDNYARRKQVTAAYGLIVSQQGSMALPLVFSKVFRSSKVNVTNVTTVSDILMCTEVVSLEVVLT